MSDAHDPHKSDVKRFQRTLEEVRGEIVADLQVSEGVRSRLAALLQRVDLLDVEFRRALNERDAARADADAARHEADAMRTLNAQLSQEVRRLKLELGLTT